MKTLSGISQILFNRFYCYIPYLALRFLYFGNSIVRFRTGNGQCHAEIRFEFPQDSLRAHTLEVNEEEKLVVNFDEVDCTTFVEYVLALALSPVKNGTIDNADYARTLQSIRYRDSKIDGYTSRLHYIADWVNNGVRHGSWKT